MSEIEIDIVMEYIYILYSNYLWFKSYFTNI